MKPFALALATLAMATLAAQPARATLLAETPPAVDNMECLALLLTNPEEHAAKCGGPFTQDTDTAPLVKGTYSPGCRLTEITPLSLIDGVWRVQVAAGNPCCATYVAPEQFNLTPGEVFRFRVAC